MSDDELRAKVEQIAGKTILSMTREKAIAPNKLGEAITREVLARFPEFAPEKRRSRRIGVVAAAALASSERRMIGTELPAPVPWTHFEEALGGGLWPGVHVIVSGTGAGKSTLCTDIALHAAKEGHHVGYVSLELDENQIGHRFIGALTGTWFSKFTTGRQTPDEHREAKIAAGKLEKLPIFIETAGPRGWHAEELTDLWEDMREGLPAKETATTAEPYRTPVIIVDYLQLVTAKEDGRSEIRERVGQAAYAAHRLSTQYGAAVVLVSSISRDNYPLVGENNKARHDQHVKAERRPNGKDADGKDLYLHDLVNSDALVGLGKESGEVEFAATSVTTMVKVPRFVGDGGQAHRVLMLAKNRLGETSWTGLCLSEGTFKQADQGKVTGALAEGGKPAVTPTTPPGPTHPTWTPMR